MRMATIHSVKEARELARKVLPPVVFDYIDGGADDEVTLRANEEAFNEIKFLPRVAKGAILPNAQTELLGDKLSFPLLLAPCGLVAIMHPDGGEGVASAAKDAGIVSILSTVSGSRLESVARHASGSLWFQLYSANGRDEAVELMEKASDVSISVIVITVDTPALGNRERDRKNGVTTPFTLRPANALVLSSQLLRRPGWVYKMGRSFLGKRKTNESMIGGHGAASSMIAMQASPFTWEDIEFFRAKWNGKLAIKGVMAPQDAKLSVEHGADAIIVSNHGGRQLDGAEATLKALPKISEAVQNKCKVLIDGGIRRGSHILKAISLGADAVLIGRPYLWGLGANGQKGVSDVIETLRSEMIRSMVLLGATSIEDLRSNSYLSPEWPNI